MSTWILKQWPVPLIAAAALILMLAAQRFGVNVPILQDTGDEADETVSLTLPTPAN